ncbi:MAG: 2-hydroxyacid dehydrogenase [Thermoplasmatota archaeon]
METERRPRILVTRSLPREPVEALRQFADLDIWESDEPMPREELLKRAVDKDGLLVLLSDRIDRELMDLCPNLKVIGNYAVGFDNIDVRYATEKGIPVINTPGVLTDATADLAFALILSSARRISEGDRLIRSGRFRSWGPKLMLGKDVEGATLGVVGAGKIGRAVLERGRGFRMKLLYNSRTRKREIEEELGAEYADLHDLLAGSDYVSLNCPLTEETHHLIGEKELSVMKDDAVLINTARGPVVDEKALYEALRKGDIAAAGLDVFENEPEVYPPLMELENVTMVPHVGSATHTTRKKMGFLVVNGMLDILNRRIPPNLVNPEVLERDEGDA